MQTTNAIVEFYGVHHDHDKAAWLEQGRGGVNALGLRARSPFIVRLRHSGRQQDRSLRRQKQNSGLWRMVGSPNWEGVYSLKQ